MNPLFADRRTAVVSTVTAATLVAIETRDSLTGAAPGDEQHDEATLPVFAAAMAMALAVTGASLGRRGRRPVPRNRASFWLGAATTWAGIGLNRWAKRTLAGAYRPVVTVLPDHEVVEDGPFALVRHPMYAGGVLMCAGVGAALGTVPTVAAWALPPLALVRRIVVEERVLSEALGERYDAFARSRARLVPGVW